MTSLKNPSKVALSNDFHSSGASKKKERRKEKKERMKERKKEIQ